MRTASAAFSTAWEQDSIQVVPRITIEFGNNRFNDGAQTVLASSTKLVNYGIKGTPDPNNPGGYIADTSPVISPTIQFFTPDEAFNNSNRNTMRWAVCDAGATCDDNFRAVDIYDTANLLDPTVQLVTSFEHGWWSENTSDSSGNFSSPEYLISTFDTARNINQVDVWFTEGYPMMNNVEIYYADAFMNWIQVFSGNLNAFTYHYSFPLSETVLCGGLKIIFHSTANPNDNARLSELQGLYVQDVSDDIVSFSLNRSRENFDGTTPVASVKSASISLVLQNTLATYSPDNPASPHYPYIDHDNKITVEIGVVEPGGNIEYIPMGIFYTDEWDTDSDQATATVTARDYSKYLQDQSPNFSKYYANQTIGTAINDIMCRAGKDPNELNIDLNAATVFGILFIDNTTYWNFLTEVAFADFGTFDFDETGNFEYISNIETAPSTTSVHDFSYDTNIINGQQKTQIYLDSVIVNVSTVNLYDSGIQSVWTPPKDNSSTVTLAYSYLQNSIGTTDQTITLNSNMDNAPQSFPSSGWVYIDTELISYDSRDSYNLYNCTRGVGGTVEASHSSGAYVGEAQYYQNLKYSTIPLFYINPPQLYNDYVGDNVVYTPPVNTPLDGSGIIPRSDIPVQALVAPIPGSPGWPYITAIDFLESLGEAPQAEIVVWNYNGFTANLAIANIVPALTALDAKSVPTYPSQAMQEIINFMTDVANNLDANGQSEEAGNIRLEMFGGNYYLLASQAAWIYGLTGTVHNKYLDWAQNFAPGGIWENYESTTIDWGTTIDGLVPILNSSRQKLRRAPFANQFNQRLVRKHGIQQVGISNKWVQTQTQATKIADWLIAQYNTPRAILTINAVPNPLLQLGDRVTVVDFPQLGLSNVDYHIISINYTYDGSLQAQYTLREALDGV